MSFKNAVFILLLIIGGYVYFKYVDEKPAQLVADVHLTSDVTGSNLEFSFANPVRYVEHFPTNTTDVLQVKIRAIGFNEFTENFSLAERYLSPTTIRENLLEDVRYEGNVPGGPFLVVRFKKQMHVQVLENNGLKGLIINYKKA